MLGVPREVGNADRSDEKEAVARPLPCLIRSLSTWTGRA
jgi:hypothetical protein